VAEKKRAFIGVNVEPALKAALQREAEAEGRSLSAHVAKLLKQRTKRRS
jgi:hypothetical protein